MNGFKAGFGSPAAMEQLGIDRPLVAPITARTLLEDGATVDIGGWTSPAIELEVAVHAGAGLSVAIELADLEFPPEDPERIVAGGIYHRHWLLGPVVEELPRAGALARDGEEVARADDPAALTGGHDYVVRVVEETIGRALAPGEVVITGSIVPPQPAVAGRWIAEIEPLGRLVVTLEGA
jgi:2-keto-4-pentenoate hydratase